MPPVAADTHTAIWHLTDSPRLSVNAKRALARAAAAADAIYIPSISLVEARYLVERGRIPERALFLLVAAVSDPGAALILVPLSLEVALAIERVPRSAVPDMPDRIIAATALYLGVPLVTADHRMRASGIPTVW